MLERLNHVAIAVPDLAAAERKYREVLGASVSARIPLADHGVTVVFVELANTNIELLEPLGPNSPIEKFLERNPTGGIHHICYEVEDIPAAICNLKESGAAILGTGKPSIGAHGKPVVFLHPKEFNGTLIELQEA